MTNKGILWIPIVGAFVSLVKWDKENGMGALWAYYQAAALVVFIWLMAFLQTAK